MKIAYIYLSEVEYTLEHNNYMAELLIVMDEAKEIHIENYKYREDIGAKEYQVNVSPWAAKFFDYMEVNDMLSIRDEPI